MPGSTPKAARLDMAQHHTADVDWVEAQLDRVGRSKSDAAEALGLHPNKMGEILRGTRRLQVPEAITLANFIEAPLFELLRRFGYDVPPSDQCDLIGVVNGRGRVSFLPPDQCEVVVAPTDADKDLKALRVEAEHTRLALYHGTVIYYLPTQMVRADAFGRLSVLDLKDEPAPVLGILDRGSYGQGVVRIYGGLETIETETVLSASPVKWQRSA